MSFEEIAHCSANMHLCYVLSNRADLVSFYLWMYWLDMAYLNTSYAPKQLTAPQPSYQIVMGI